MLRRLLAVLYAPALVAASVGGAVPGTAATSAPSGLEVVAPVAFSPDGDGVQDRIRVRIKLPDPAAKVVVEVTSYYGQKVVRTVTLRKQPAGVTTWTWDGRSDRGTRLPDGPYVVKVRAVWADPGIPRGAPRIDVVQLDTEFDPALSAPTFGVAEGKATYRVFPRSTAVRDSLPLRARIDEHAVKSLSLVIRDSAGRVVQMSDVNRVIEESSLGYIPNGDGGLEELKARGRTVEWTGRRGGATLPQGRYTAAVEGRDRAGNRGRSQTLRLVVSRDRLVWKDASAAVAPSSSTTSDCYLFDLDKCGDLPPCAEVVDSAAFPEGLSYRSGVPQQNCSGDQAVRLHILEVPAAAGVRGVATARVSFTGAATNPGEADTGTLTLLAASPDPAEDRSVSGVSGTTDHVSHLFIGDGVASTQGVLTVPSVVWGFATTGGSWFDVASFRVDYRYLVVDL